MTATRLARQLIASLAAALIVTCSSGSPDSAAPALPIPGLPAVASNASLRVLVTRSQAGGPVAGAHVCAARATSAPVCADSNKDGTATITAPRGTYFVRVNGPSEQRWQETTRVIDLATGSGALWVELEQLHRIAGTVRDEAGKRVVDAIACAHPAIDEATVCSRSGSDGTYTIDVKMGIYRLEVSGPPGGRLVSQWARGRAFLEEADVLDARTTDVPDVDVDLVRGVVLRGVVTFQGKVVEDAQVCLRTLAAPLPLECERTDKQGRYAALREPGQYYIWSVPPGNILAIPQWFDRAATGVGSTAINLFSDRAIDIDFFGGTTIRGTVRTDAGDVVANALVCFDTPFPTGRICRETGGDGRYTITTRPETYVVNVIPPEHSDLIAEYWQRARTWPEADEYRVGTSDQTLDLVVRRGTRVTGTVKDKRDIGVAAGYVNFWDDNGIAAATQTDAAGRFELVVLPGHYRVEAFPPFVANLVGKVFEADVPNLSEMNIVLDDVAP
jgi:hypothetical protein